MRTLIKVTAALIMTTFIVACGGDDDDFPTITPTPTPEPTPEPETIVDVATAAGSFTTLIAALEATGLDDTLNDTSGTFTVFAPTDDAFEDLLDELDLTAEELLASDSLEDILLYHVISGSEIDSTAAIASAGMPVSMANGDNVGLSLDGDNLLVNLSLVTAVDVEADNGVIHVIDTVLLPPADPGTPTMNIVETAQADDSFSTLVAALTAADLVTTLSDEDATFTVFAPTNDAFEALGDANVAALLEAENIDTLTDILLQHVVAAEVNSITAYTLNGTDAMTAGMAEIPVAIEGGELRFGGAEVEITDIYTTNGIIHVIDTVIVADVDLPRPAENIAEVATAAGSFSILLQALVETGLDATLTNEDGAFTVFAPTDDAFEALLEDLGLTAEELLALDTLEDILLYHVLVDAEVFADSAIGIAASDDSKITMGNMDMAALSLGDDDELFINTSEVTAANVLASNGVIHVVDTVLLPPAEMGTPTLNIVETAVADGNFTTLVSALQAAGLDSALADENSTFTVFAPTDAAFDAVDDGVLAALLADTDALTAVLQRHVISGAAVDSVTAFTLNDSEVETLGGFEIGIEIDDGALEVGGAVVEVFDIYTTNGVIHVIDAVIIGDAELPEPLDSIIDVAMDAGSFTTLLAALDEAELTSALDDFDSTFTVFAPTDDAFAALLEALDVTAEELLADPDLSDILLYHVIEDAEVDAATAIGMAGMTVEMMNGDEVALSLNGDSLLVNLSTVTTADVSAANGIIHIIDAVLLPPEDAGMPDMNIVETAEAAGSFTTLLAALDAASLVTTLADEDASFTVFAPTDAAFDIIPDDTLTALLDDTDALTDVLLQHVVDGEVNSINAFAANGTGVPTLAMGNEDVAVEIVDFRDAENTMDDEVAYDADAGILVGGMGSSDPGFSLYVFDTDLGTSGSECNDTCATNWPPVLVTDGTASSIPGLGTVTRDDDSIQATYNGRPLYFYAGDTMVGDTTGQGLGDVWWLVELDPVVLQIQGATVSTTDIYTSNGVIHVIDSVITETLQ